MSKLNSILLNTTLLLVSACACGQDDVFEGKEISFPASDGLEITADLYEADTKNDGTYIILFHQANSSRGEYRTIAPKLVEFGYNCLAVDQRSGHEGRGIINRTCKRAIAANKKIRFVNAIQDIESAFLYARDMLNSTRVIIWGSSYSAAAVLYLGSKYPDDVAAILSFSPGEYYEIAEKKIATYAADVRCPVFITSAKNEKKDWIDIYDNISSEKDYFLPERNGFHGSKALWPEKLGYESYWDAVMSFLNKINE
jgi:pimeloyl-ACP methyl ester carboxylesterase